MFGFACSRCWNKECSCTPQQLQEFESNRSKLKPVKIVYSVSEPKVTKNDIVIFEGKQYLVVEIIGGYPSVKLITNNAHEFESDMIQLTGGYKILRYDSKGI
jgi:hypothetical protein